jgi:farnesyl diphosphate synthase
MGLNGAQAYAQALLSQALAALDTTGLTDLQTLRSLAKMVVQRSH